MFGGQLSAIISIRKYGRKYGRDFLRTVLFKINNDLKAINGGEAARKILVIYYLSCCTINAAFLCVEKSNCVVNIKLTQNTFLKWPRGGLENLRQ
jgi:hypothetical protein